MIASQIYSRISAAIEGIICPEPDIPDLAIRALEWLIYRSGNGDHLEIGTLCGGSAIAAALIKEYYGLRGNVITIDPFDSSLLSETVIEALNGVIPTPELVYRNAERFGVRDRITVIEGKSSPLPVAFVKSAYIDGDHNQAAVDWENVKIRTDWVLFDDCLGFQSTRDVIETIRRENKWTVESDGGLCLVHKR